MRYARLNEKIISISMKREELSNSRVLMKPELPCVAMSFSFAVFYVRYLLENSVDASDFSCGCESRKNDSRIQ